MIPQRQPHRSALAIALAERVLIQLAVFLGGPPQQPNLLAREHAPRNHKAIGFIRLQNVVFQGTCSHVCLLFARLSCEWPDLASAGRWTYMPRAPSPRSCRA